jgi:mono/diheme cytochrome c family protein
VFKFLFGVIVGVLLLPCIVIGMTIAGRISVRATAEPPGWERVLAQFLLHRAISAQAGATKNPYAPTEANLLEGLKYYRDGCDGCHGLANKKSEWGAKDFYPRAPQFGFEPTQLTEEQLYYVIKHGIRNTGMGGSTEERVWKLAGFVSRMKSLPPAVAAEWKKQN